MKSVYRYATYYSIYDIHIFISYMIYVYVYGVSVKAYRLYLVDTSNLYI